MPANPFSTVILVYLIITFTCDGLVQPLVVAGQTLVSV